MNDYSFKELADMYYCYGFADGESKEAALIYAQKFPTRRHPDAELFEKIDVQLREKGDLSHEDPSSADPMADTEIKRKGRPKKREAEVTEAPPKKAAAVSNGDDATPPVKRGRGRPPKATVAVPKKTPTPGRGRGRPPKSAVVSKKKKVSEDEEEEDEDDDEEKKESSEEEVEST